MFSPVVLKWMMIMTKDWQKHKWLEQQTNSTRKGNFGINGRLTFLICPLFSSWPSQQLVTIKHHTMGIKMVPEINTLIKNQLWFLQWLQKYKYKNHLFCLHLLIITVLKSTLNYKQKQQHISSGSHTKKRKRKEPMFPLCWLCGDLWATWFIIKQT